MRRISPDWAYWAQIPETKLWKCVALSCDIEPRLLDRGTPAIYGGVSGPPNYEVLRDLGLGRRARTQATRLAKRREIAGANLGRTLESSESAIGRSLKYHAVAIGEFVRWAEAMQWDAPTEFWRLRNDATQAERGQSKAEHVPLEIYTNTQNDASKPRPELQQNFQEKEIIRVIKELGYSIDKMPEHKGGAKGIKSAVREKLELSNGQFNKAWERIRQRPEFREVKGVRYSPKLG